MYRDGKRYCDICGLEINYQQSFLDMAPKRIGERRLRIIDCRYDGDEHYRELSICDDCNRELQEGLKEY